MSIADRQQLEVRDVSFDGLFPLPLSTFELFMFTDSRPDYPMMCDLEMNFQGSIDRAAFDAALASAVAKHPLFRSRIELQRRGLVWIPSEEGPSVDWAPLGTPLGDRYGQFVDLTKEIGLRIWVRNGLERSTVLVHFHHACSDAIGSFGFIEDLLADYAGFYASGRPAERPFKPARLVGRNDVGMGHRSIPRQLVDVFVGAYEGWKFLLERPLPLPEVATPEAVAGSQQPLQSGFLSQTFSEELTSGLRRAATRAGVTVNDVLLRDMFLTLRRWSAEHGEQPRKRRLRILMPQSLRGREERVAPAANMMGFAFITRKANWCDNPDGLLRSIRAETGAIRRGFLSLYFTGGMASVQSWGALPRLLRGRNCFATAVLTNLGDPTRRFSTRFPRSSDGLVVGNLVFQGIRGVPPLRPLTRAAFSVHNSARALAVSLKCDPHSYRPLDAQQLLNQYVDQLQTTASRALTLTSSAGT